MTSGEALLLRAGDARSRSSSIGAWPALARRRPGDRLVLALSAYDPPVAADLICAVYGALRLGVIPVVLDASGSAQELDELIADAAPIASIRTPQDLWAALNGPEDPGLGTTLLGRPMHYTSGTTGRRKGVYSGALARAAGAALWAEEISWWGMTSDDVHIVMSPLHHSAPLRFALATLLAGGSVVLPGRFEPHAFIAACERFGASAAFTAPAQLQRLKALHDGPDPADGGALAARIGPALARFRMLAHAGSPCPETVKRWLLEHTDPGRIWEFYGSTEGQFTACSGTEWLARPGTVGRARPGRALVIDEDERIWCAVPEFARFQYWGAPEKTAAAWREGGDGPAFTVGDAGHLDGDGYLYLHGRRDDLIISGGVNVYPAEVERVLGAVPGVDEVAVFGVPDDQWGQRVEAVILGTATPEAVLAAAATALPPARRPKRVHLSEDLPRTSTGKILRRELPGRYGAQPQDHRVRPEK